LLAFFSDILLLILPALNSGWTLYVILVLGLNLSKLKKGALRGSMIFSSVSIPFVLAFRFTPLEENISPFAEYLCHRIYDFGWMLLLGLLGLGIISLLRLHVFGGKSNAPAKASGKIHQWNFRDFFRKRWRWLFYATGIYLFVVSINLILFYMEHWSDLHLN
jgi:hypothetical protein